MTILNKNRKKTINIEQQYWLANDDNDEKGAHILITVTMLPLSMSSVLL